MSLIKTITFLYSFVKKKIILRLRIVAFNIKSEITRIYFNMMNIITNYTNICLRKHLAPGLAHIETSVGL